MTGPQVTDQRDLGALIPAQLDDAGLDPYAFRVYARIARRAGRAGECWESQQEMATGCGMSVRKLRDSLRELEARQFIRSVEREDRDTVTWIMLALPPAPRAAPPGTTCPPPRQEVPDTPAPGADKGVQVREPTEGGSSVSAAADPGDEYEPEVRQLCREFAQRLVANQKGVPKKGTGAHRRWLEDMRKLLEYGQSSTMEGGHIPTVEDVALVIAYVTTDDFERDNVLSPGKLRKRWDQLYGKATRARAGTNGSGRGDTAMDVVSRALAAGRYQ